MVCSFYRLARARGGKPVLTAVWVVILAAAAWSAPEAKRRPVPTEAAQAEAGKLVREVYGSRYDRAKTAEEKAALSRKLLAQAASAGNDDATRYVLLRIARDVAVQAGDAELALEAVDRIAEAYQVDALARKVEVLPKVAASSRTAAQNAALVEQARPIIDQLVAADRYDPAKQLAGLTARAASKTRDKKLIGEIADQKRRVTRLAEAYGAVSGAMETLQGKPGDPEANLAVGSFLCLQKGDWARGLPMLALGSDARLKALATKEIQGLASADEKARLADGWFELGEAEKGPEGVQLKRRAYHWYRQAEAGMAGLARAKVQTRIEQLRKELPDLEEPVPVGEIHRFDGENLGVFSPDGRRILTSSRDNALRLWDVETKREVRRFEGHTARPRLLCFSPEGQLIVSGGADRTIRVWDADSGRQLHSFQAEAALNRWQAVVSAGGKRLLWPGGDRRVRVTDLNTGKELHSFDIRHGGTHVYIVGFSGDGRWALSGGFEPTARLWNVTTGKAVNFNAHAHVYGGALSPDGRLGLTAGGDLRVRLWDMATRKELARYAGHTGHVYVAAFSPDGRRILSGDGNTVVRLWDTKTAKELHCYRGHTKQVSRVAFSPDGRYGLSSGSDDTVRLLGLPE